MEAHITFKPFKDQPSQTNVLLNLVKTPAGWRIDNIIPADTAQGLRALYTQDEKNSNALDHKKQAHH
jgi:hypothetical protein